MAVKAQQSAVKNGQKPSEISGKPAGKLSSGIMGMKFMQKEEIEEDAHPKEEKEEDTSDKAHNEHKFKHHDDPGAWFSSYSDKFKNSHLRGGVESAVIGYADLFKAPSGRKSYGTKPVDPEISGELSKNEVSGGSRKGKKRLSEEGSKLKPKKRKSL